MKQLKTNNPWKNNLELNKEKDMDKQSGETKAIIIGKVEEPNVGCFIKKFDKWRWRSKCGKSE